MLLLPMLARYKLAKGCLLMLQSTLTCRVDVSLEMLAVCIISVLVPHISEALAILGFRLTQVKLGLPSQYGHSIAG